MTAAVATFGTLLTRNHHLLGLIILLVMVAGSSALLTLPRIEDPRITTRNATVITPYPGASARRVEALVSKKIEDRLREVTEIKTIQSESRSSVSVISIELQDWVGPTDNELVFGKIRDRLSMAASELPPDAGTPVFDDMRGAVAYSMILALAWKSGEAHSMGRLQRVAEQLGDRLRILPGSEQLVYFGPVEEEIAVDVDPAEAAALGLSVQQVAARIAAADARRPAGSLRQLETSLPLEVSGALDSVQRIAAIPVASDPRGGLLHVGDIAQVKKSWQSPPEQIALHNGSRSILIAVRTEADLHLDTWAQRARAEVERFTTQLDADLQLQTVFDQSRYTDERLGRLAGNLLAGVGVVMLVVWVTMGWRAALIVGSALPLSAGLSLFGLTLFGEPIHQMSIFGMIIAIGLLIDNAIVMTDRVMQQRSAGASAGVAVQRALKQLLVPLLASTLTTILGFMPIFLLPGNVGDFVGPIAISVVLALLASFVLAVTVIPALAARFTQQSQQRPGWWRSGWQSRRLSQAYRRLLVWAIGWPKTTLLISALVPIVGMLLAGQLKMQFFPAADRNQIEIQVWLPQGTSIDQTAARVRQIEAVLREDPSVTGVTWVAGASSPPVYYNQLREQDQNPQYARGVVVTIDTAAAKRLEAQLQQQLGERFTDAQIVVKAFGQGPPIEAPVGFRLVGPDAEVLRLQGERLRELLQRQPEITHTRASVEGGEAKLWLDADEREAAAAGLSLTEVARQFQAALDGSVGGRLLEDVEDLPVRVRYSAMDRDSITDLSTLRLNAGSSHDWIPANALGELRLAPQLSSISRRNGERVNEISAYLRQDALAIEVTKAVTAKIAEGALDLPEGYRLELAGDSAEQQRAVRQLFAYVPVLATLMIAILVLTFRSVLLAGLITLVALFAAGLGMLSLWVSGFPLGFNPLIGLAGLVGVAINGSIVVLAALRDDPAARAGESQAIVAQTVGATRHIVSTTLTTVAGFLPLLLFNAGDFWPPLAVVIAGGVGLSGILSLLFTPAAYRILTPLHRSKTGVDSSERLPRSPEAIA